MIQASNGASGPGSDSVWPKVKTVVAGAAAAKAAGMPRARSAWPVPVMTMTGPPVSLSAQALGRDHSGQHVDRQGIAMGGHLVRLPGGLFGLGQGASKAKTGRIHPKNRLCALGHCATHISAVQRCAIDPGRA